MKAYHIDSAARTIEEVEYGTLADMRRFVGGYIEAAAMYPNGDTLYVGEEGLSKIPTGFFWVAGRTDQPMVGNGLYVGREVRGPHGFFTLRPGRPLDAVREIVRFVSREQFDAWAKGNASEPAITITTGGTTEVVARVGKLFSLLPRATD